MEFINILTEALIGQGIWTICAVCLTVYTIKTSGEREAKLHTIIEKYADKFDIIDDKVDKLQDDINEIKKG